MKTKKAIKMRKSTRIFLKKSIKKDVIMNILDSGRRAPSAKNRQPWYFVITKNDKKDDIADMMIKYTENKESLILEKEKIGYKSSVRATARIIKEAPVLILIFRPNDENWVIGDSLSIGACVQNMCLRATELGIGSLWIRDITYVSKDVAEYVNHKDMELNCALALGYSNDKSKRSSRKKLNDIVEWKK